MNGRALNSKLRTGSSTLLTPRICCSAGAHEMDYFSGVGAGAQAAALPQVRFGQPGQNGARPALPCRRSALRKGKAGCTPCRVNPAFPFPCSRRCGPAVVAGRHRHAAKPCSEPIWQQISCLINSCWSDSYNHGSAGASVGRGDTAVSLQHVQPQPGGQLCAVGWRGPAVFSQQGHHHQRVGFPGRTQLSMSSKIKAR